MAAGRWRDRLFTKIETLAADPHRCPLAPEDEIFDGILRELLTGKRPHVFRILFEVRDHEVVVLRVRHGSQDSLDEGEI